VCEYPQHADAEAEEAERDATVADGRREGDADAGAD
jgi:hypothetical protein